MNFFNKFKWHIWQSSVTKLWYVRKLNLFGYKYLSKTTNHAWKNPINVRRWCAHDTYASADYTLLKINSY